MSRMIGIDKWGVFGAVIAVFGAVTTANGTDHSTLIAEYTGPGQCLSCHANAIGETPAVSLTDIHHSVHYRMESELPAGYQHDEAGVEVGFATSGKMWKLCGFPTTVPQFNWLGKLRDDPVTPHIDKPGGCAKCHIGIGMKPFNILANEGPTAADDLNIDCLICHAENYNRKFYVAVKDGSPELNGMGSPIVLAVPKVDGALDWSAHTEAARTVTSTSSATCLRCHVAAGGGKFEVDEFSEASFKRGSVFDPGKDVHADYGMSCADCHYAGTHKFKRPLNNDLSAHDVVVDHEMCLDCHDAAPHEVDEYNQHTQHLSCTACHARTEGGATFKDFSVTVPPEDGNPLALYAVLVKFASSEFETDFQWFNGTVGPEITPLGSRGDGKIYPYKAVKFNQPVDVDGHPIPMKWGPFFTTGNMTAATSMGRSLYEAMWTPEIGAKYGLPPVPGEFDHFGVGHCGGFSISHGITKEHALKCAGCHNPASVMNLPKLGYSSEDVDKLENLLGLPMMGDFTGDDKVDASDLLMFQEFWHGSQDAMLKKLNQE